jgi:phosphoserine phosphatase RsbX
MSDGAESGDLCVVHPFPGGLLVAVLDGTGHGQEAAAAVKIASGVLESHAGESPIPLVRRCHEKLRFSRGAALSIASIRTSEGLMTWLGVGNVEGILLRSDPTAEPKSESLLVRPGVVGRSLPPLAAEIVPIEDGDTLVFTTDGVSLGFTELIAASATPQWTADLILARHGKKSDDALVVVARCRENGS